MALDYLEGFDYLATADLTLGPTPVFTSISGATVQSVTKRTGASALSITAITSYAIASGLSNAATRVLGFALYITNVAAGAGTTGLVALGDGGLVNPSGGAHITLSVNGAGNLLVHRGRDLSASGTGTLLATSTNALSSATWYYLEIVVTISDSVGAVEVFVNGSKTNWIDLSGVDTKHTGAAQINAFGFAGNGSACIYDDVYCLSTTGGVRTARLGDRKVIAVGVDGNGATTNFTPSAGSNFQNVDDATPNGDTDYNESTSVGDVDLYTVAAMTGVGVISGIKISSYCKKSDASTCDVTNVLRLGSTNYEQAQRGAGTSYGWHADILEQSPATLSDATAAELAAGEIGVKQAA